MTAGAHHECVVCQSTDLSALVRRPSPAITSITTIIASETVVFACPRCGHCQTPEFGDLKQYYASDYKLLLSDMDADDLYVGADGEVSPRSEHQAQTVLSLIAPANDAVGLDYGAAKGATACKILDRRPDLDLHLYDVSDDYTPFWRERLPNASSAVHQEPKNWKNKFDFIYSYFVLEHIHAPISFLKKIFNLLKSDGKFLLVVPDVYYNSADLICVDHLNHFSHESLTYALNSSGFSVDFIDDAGVHFGGLAVVASPADVKAKPAAKPEKLAHLEQIGGFWAHADEAVRRFVDALPNGANILIYGAGFWGVFAASAAGGRATGFVDRNPHLVGKIRNGLPVFDVSRLCESTRPDAIIMGVNPKTARAIIPSTPGLNDFGGPIFTFASEDAR